MVVLEVSDFAGVRQAAAKLEVDNFSLFSTAWLQANHADTTYVAAGAHMGSASKLCRRLPGVYMPYRAPSPVSNLAMDHQHTYSIQHAWGCHVYDVARTSNWRRNKP